MKRRNNFLLVVVAAIIALSAAACSATAHVEKDETVNFSRYKTYSWVSDNEKSLKDRNSNSLVDHNIKAAVAKQLERNGWVENNAHPDVLLDYNIMVENSVKQRNNPVYSRPFTRYFYNPYTRRITSFYYPSQMLGFENAEIPYKEGTITLHMIENGTNKLIWQGWTTNEVDSHNLTGKEINASVKTILRKFNPSGSQS